jgi:hypothetical protein
MTEVRPSNEASGYRCLGLFATQAYAPGEVILEEAPIIALAQSESNHDDTWAPMFRTDRARHSPRRLRAFLQRQIPVPNVVPPEYEGKFYGMMVALVTYAMATPLPPEHPLWTLYSPLGDTDLTTKTSSADPERIIDSIAREALRALQHTAAKESKLDVLLTHTPNTCLQIMLIWSYNAFQEGLIFQRMSRVNHSCDPNATVSTKPNQETTHQLVATSHILAGEEILISYLGIFTFAGYTTRQQILIFSKHFTCSCSRCQRCSILPNPSTSQHSHTDTLSDTHGDLPSAIPCPICHPRIGKGHFLLEEELHYDDFHEEQPDSDPVHYVIPITSSTQESSIVYHCPSCNTIPINQHVSKILSFNNKVIKRITTHLQSTTTAPRYKTHMLDCKQTQTDMTNKLEMIEELFHLSSSVLGARHWCTNLVQLQLLEYNLAALHASMLFSNLQGHDHNHPHDETAATEGGEPPDLIQLAECIDSLSKLWSFLEMLQLKAHPGHVLSGVTIGVARILVSLGDVKSKKYGAQWIEKVEAYIHQGHEGDSMKRVVDNLKNAWIMTHPSDDATTAAAVTTSATALLDHTQPTDENKDDSPNKKMKW